jgi:quinoprotein glucose dehydrogenase
LIRSSFVWAAAAAAVAIAADERSFTTWTSYLGGADSSQYTSLKQIDKSNVKQLAVAWTYDTGEKGNYLFNPVVIGGAMYVLAKNNSIVALDAATGKEIWVHPSQGAVGTRGLNYWASQDGADRRLIYINAGFLTEIDAPTGETIQSFGDNGRADIRVGLDRDTTNIRPLQTNNPGRVFENFIIVSLPAGGAAYDAIPADVHAYDVRTGKLAWVFHSIPRPGEFGYDTWPPDAWKTAGGVHNWNEMTVDEKRGIVYIPFGTARYDFYGANRRGADLFGNSLVALDARTGKRLWHFQLVHHDLWDYDLPAAPKLLTVRHNGRMVDVVAQATKQGFLFVFDRVTGQPLWPIEERPAPKSDVPGEESWPTQPFPTLPPPFARQSFTEKDINPYLHEAEREAVRERLRNSRNEGLFTPPSFRGTIELPGHNGGANWGSSAVDPTHGTMYIVSKELPTYLKLQPPGAGRGGRSGAAPEPPATDDSGFIRYNAPYDFMLTSNGLSAIGPPWSQLTAYDLNTGKILWQVPNGEVSALASVGIAGTGSQFPRGGVLVTGGGLLFVTTSSDKKLRAYDQDTGKVVWETPLPAASEGVPAAYEIDGREYLVFCVAGANGMMVPHIGSDKAPPPPGSASYMVFALPKR